MEYYKDLLMIKKNKFATVLGALFIILALATIAIKWYKNSIILLDWFNLAIYLLLGAVMIMYAFGYSVERLFYKAYVKISNDTIQLKTKPREPEQTIQWSKMSGMELANAQLKIDLTDGTKFAVSLSQLDYASIQEIKEVLGRIATAKNIPFGVA